MICQNPPPAAQGLVSAEAPSPIPHHLSSDPATQSKWSDRYIAPGTVSTLAKCRVMPDRPAGGWPMSAPRS
jgi:hypothetical protein